MKKIALCFLVTKNIINLDVWKKWWKGNEDKINIYSHFSKKGSIDQPELTKNRVNPVPTKWGDISLVNAEKQLYRAAYKNKSNVSFVLISDSCVPVKSFNIVYKKLTKDVKRGIAPYRSLGKYYKDDLAPFRDKKPCISLLDKFNFFTETAYACDQWKALSRNNVKDFFKMYKNKNYVKLFSKFCTEIIPDSLAPDELMYINWLRYLYGSKNLSKHLRNGLVTYVDFKGKAIHPINYRQITPALKDYICYSGGIFARKFVNPLEKRLLSQLPLKCHEKKSRKRSSKQKKSRKRS